LLADHHADRFRVLDGDLVFLISSPLDEVSASRHQLSLKPEAIRKRRSRERRRNRESNRSR
jgi:hypothetical protein